jgi:hypothetical protein
MGGPGFLENAPPARPGNMDVHVFLFLLIKRGEIRRQIPIQVTFNLESGLQKFAAPYHVLGSKFGHFFASVTVKHAEESHPRWLPTVVHIQYCGMCIFLSSPFGVLDNIICIGGRLLAPLQTIHNEITNQQVAIYRSTRTEKSSTAGRSHSHTNTEDMRGCGGKLQKYKCFSVETIRLKLGGRRHTISVLHPCMAVTPNLKDLFSPSCDSCAPRTPPLSTHPPSQSLLHFQLSRLGDVSGMPEMQHLQGRGSQVLGYFVPVLTFAVMGALK